MKTPRYPRLVKELAIILVIKVIVLMGVKAIWFDAPTVPQNGTERVEQRLLGSSHPL